MESQFIDTNGIKLHFLTAGSGPLLILLHGFPESSYAWRHQIEPLSKKFQVVIPDLRGYGESSRPEGIANYAPDLLAKDIVGLIKALGKEKAHIVGHDFGGSIAWHIAIRYSKVVDHLVVINCPHPVLLKKALTSNFQQMKKSWYIFFFQLPYLPELYIKSQGGKFWQKVFKGNLSKKGSFTDDDIAVYEKNFSKPGALTAALNYYRAALRSKASLRGQIKSPTLLLWGENDKALGKELTFDMEPLFSGSFQIKYIPNCGHFVMEEDPEIVTEAILKFCS